SQSRAPALTSPRPFCIDRGHRGQSGDPFGDIEDTCRTSRRRFGKRIISMPWRELTVIDQREEFAKLALAQGANLSELCRRFGISRSNGHKWLSRYLKQGREGLAARSRRPHC